jgi:undecaprenyl-diphosphatase
VSFFDSLLIGLSQALAIIPGVSRSGVTITTGLARGLNRTAAAHFSFLMAMPITFGACLVKAKEFFHSGLSTESLIGVGVSALVGFLSIKYMLAYLRKYSYRIFVIYRFLFAIVVTASYFSGIRMVDLWPFTH